MQYKVPQNVDIEDKVVGPLTLRQFLILLVTFGLILTLYFMFPGPLKFFFFLLALFVGIAGGAIAFTKYGDQNMETFLMSAFRTFSSPRQRIWKKVPEPVLTMVSADEAPVEKGPKTKAALSEKRDDLSKLAALVDSGGYVSVAKKDRVIGEIEKPEIGTEPEEIADVLGHAEQASPILDKTIATAQASAPKREPLVSEVASIKPPQNITYPKIEVKN
jgi:hypothetical protein